MKFVLSQNPITQRKFKTDEYKERFLLKSQSKVDNFKIIN